MKIANNLRLDTAKFLYFSLLFTIFTIPIYNSFTSIGLGLVIFFFIINSFFNTSGRSVSIDIIIWGVFILISLFSLSNSPDLAVSNKYLRKFTLYMFLYFSVLRCATNEKYLKGLVFCLIVSATIASLDGLFQYLTGSDWFSSRQLMTYPHLGLKRITGPMHQAGSLGILLGCIIPLAISIAIFYNNKTIRYLLWSSVSFMLAALFLTYAPGAALGLFCALIMFCILKNRYVLILSFVVMLIIAYISLPHALTKWPDGSLATSIIGRMMIWKTSLKAFTIHPLIGHGIGSFAKVYNQICIPGSPHCEGGAPLAHNQYIQLLVETGILGFSCFFMAVSLIVVKAFKRALENSINDFKKSALIGLLCSLTAYSVHGLFESSLYTYHGSLIFWTELGVIRTLISQSYHTS